MKPEIQGGRGGSRHTQPQTLVDIRPFDRHNLLTYMLSKFLARSMHMYIRYITVTQARITGHPVFVRMIEKNPCASCVLILSLIKCSEKRWRSRYIEAMYVF